MATVVLVSKEEVIWKAKGTIFLNTPQVFSILGECSNKSYALWLTANYCLYLDIQIRILQEDLVLSCRGVLSKFAKTKL